MPCSAASAREKVHIEQVLDCNLFRLKDGRTIQLANVETPSLADTSWLDKRVTRQILDYIKKGSQQNPGIYRNCGYAERKERLSCSSVSEV